MSIPASWIRPPKPKETLPLETIINQCVYEQQKLESELREYVPPKFHYLIESLSARAHSVGALRVVAKAGDQAQILLEGVVK